MYSVDTLQCTKCVSGTWDSTMDRDSILDVLRAGFWRRILHGTRCFLGLSRGRVFKGLGSRAD